MDYCVKPAMYYFRLATVQLWRWYSYNRKCIACYYCSHAQETYMEYIGLWWPLPISHERSCSSCLVFANVFAYRIISQCLRRSALTTTNWYLWMLFNTETLDFVNWFPCVLIFWKAEGNMLRHNCHCGILLKCETGSNCEMFLRQWTFVDVRYTVILKVSGSKNASTLSNESLVWIYFFVHPMKEGGRKYSPITGGHLCNCLCIWTPAKDQDIEWLIVA